MKRILLIFAVAALVPSWANADAQVVEEEQPPTQRSPSDIVPPTEKAAPADSARESYTCQTRVFHHRCWRWRRWCR